jgi:VanZ family protein
MIAGIIARQRAGGANMDWKLLVMKSTYAAALYLFWPAVALIAWGELTPHPPAITEHIWDKALHFTAYFGLASMATVVLGVKRRTLWALLGIVVLGGVLEILQGYTGRDPDIHDAIANTLGAMSGASVAVGFLHIFGRRSAVGVPAE